MDHMHFKLVIFLLVFCSLIIMFAIWGLYGRIEDLIRILQNIYHHGVNSELRIQPVTVYLKEKKKKKKSGAGASALLGDDKPATDSQRFTVEALSLGKDTGKHRV